MRVGVVFKKFVECTYLSQVYFGSCSCIGKSSACFEYPFPSTKEETAIFDARRRMNNAHDTMLRNFYDENGIKDGDAFYVSLSMRSYGDGHLDGF